MCQNMKQDDAIEAGGGKWQAGRVGAHNRPNRAAAFPNGRYVDPHYPQPGASRNAHCSTRSTADIEQVRIAWEVELTQESLDLPIVARRAGPTLNVIVVVVRCHALHVTDYGQLD